MAAVFRRGKFYWIRYTLDGKQRRESLCTRSEKVAKMKLRQYEVALDSGTFQSPSKTFLETFLTEHVNHLKGIRPKKSWVNEKNRIECFAFVSRDPKHPNPALGRWLLPATPSSSSCASASPRKA